MLLNATHWIGEVGRGCSWSIRGRALGNERARRLDPGSSVAIGGSEPALELLALTFVHLIDLFGVENLAGALATTRGVGCEGRDWVVGDVRSLVEGKF